MEFSSYFSFVVEGGEGRYGLGVTKLGEKGGLALSTPKMIHGQCGEMDILF